MSRVSTATLIVCESAPRWAVLLRRFAADLDVREARSLALADDMLRDTPASFLAVAADNANAPEALLKLASWRRDYPASITAVLMDELAPDLELGFREAGAQLVIGSLFELPLLARLVQRHCQRVA